MKKPTPLQQHCIPRIVAGNDVLGIAQTGSGKTAAFALPILHRLAEDPYGVFALVMTPMRELAYQLAEQFRALGSSLQLRCAVIVGGMNMINQGQTLMPTPGRVKVLLEDNPDIPSVFSKTKFLVLDEADRLLDVGFEEELRVHSAKKAYFYEAYEGFKTVESLKQQYVLVPKNVKDVYLLYILSKMDEMGIRSAIIFVSTCRDCHLLSLLLEELDQTAAAPILLATDVGSRGLDIPTVDLVINYDIPRYPRDYVHRVGRTARAGRGGLTVSFVTENDIDPVHETEAVIGKELEVIKYEETEVLADISKVYKAKRMATMKMMEDGFEEKTKERKAQKLKTLAERGLLKKHNKKRKRHRSAEE
ncbi:hypothetical protein NE237_031728 [Protea cynaroides]|uniref:DEAD-box ATP-dependent RNA helicase 36 n=1 Tax=Protea cynaroides TaxID=273540 RepID=A0A9Q0L246_9MAGN|nr:hypothetical protein NE237_031728 [Protea cynaroides]